jgi:hypothetical protein
MAPVTASRAMVKLIVQQGQREDEGEVGNYEQDLDDHAVTKQRGGR